MRFCRNYLRLWKGPKVTHEKNPVLGKETVTRRDLRAGMPPSRHFWGEASGFETGVDKAAVGVAQTHAQCGVDNKGGMARQPPRREQVSQREPRLWLRRQEQGRN